MASQVLVSVLVPAYNAARFLPQAFDTIRTQTVPVDEVVVVDDGSSDDTAAVAERFGARVVREPHRGLAAARNAGLRHVKNDWIAFLDADDIWHPRKLELQLEALASDPDVGLIFTDFDAVSASDGRIHRGSVVADDASFRRIKRQALTPQSDLLDFEEFLRELAIRPVVQPSAAMFRRDVALAIGGFAVNLKADDTDFFLRVASRTKTAFVNVPLLAYMQHPSQMTAHFDLDTVRLQLHQHVLLHKSSYHRIVSDVFEREHAKKLYYAAAGMASKKRPLAAAALLAKAVAVACYTRQLAVLPALVLRSRVIGSRVRRAPTVQLGNGERLVRTIDIPWRPCL